MEPTVPKVVSAFEAAGRAVCLYDHMHRRFHGNVTGQSCKFLSGLHSNFLASSARLARMGEYLTTSIEQRKGRNNPTDGVTMEHIREFQDLMALVRSSKTHSIRPTLLQSEEIDAGYYGKRAEMNAALREWVAKNGSKKDGSGDEDSTQMEDTLKADEE